MTAGGFGRLSTLVARPSPHLTESWMTKSLGEAEGVGWNSGGGGSLDRINRINRIGVAHCSGVSMTAGVLAGSRPSTLDPRRAVPERCRAAQNVSPPLLILSRAAKKAWISSQKVRASPQKTWAILTKSKGILIKNTAILVKSEGIFTKNTAILVKSEGNLTKNTAVLVKSEGVLVKSKGTPTLSPIILLILAIDSLPLTLRAAVGSLSALRSDSVFLSKSPCQLIRCTRASGKHCLSFSASQTTSYFRSARTP